MVGEHIKKYITYASEMTLITQLARSKGLVGQRFPTPALRGCFIINHHNFYQCIYKFLSFNLNIFIPAILLL